MAIYSALKKDHEEVKEILQKLEKNPDDDNLINQLKAELQEHNPAEEKVFYKPLGKLLGKLNIIVDTGEKEHNAAMDLIDRYITLNGKTNERKPLLAVIKKALLAHIDVEENEVFKLAKAHLSQGKAQEMEKAFEMEKKRIKGG